MPSDSSVIFYQNLLVFLNILNYLSMLIKTIKQDIALKEVIQETPDIYTFVFDSEKPFNWKSGQYATFAFKNIKLDKGTSRTFSIAASPLEKVIRISTVITETPSPFKAHLKKSKPGDIMEIKGPYGSFFLDGKKNQVIGIAGGIGITPFRAILFDLANNESFKNINLDLIYSAKEGNFAYKDILSKFSESKNITIHYANNRDETSELLDRLVKKHGNKAAYYISGPPTMVESINSNLIDKKIKNISYDPFWGY